MVVEIDPALKCELYSALAREGLTLKAWFVRQATGFLDRRNQLDLFRRTDLPPNGARGTNGSERGE